MEGEAALQALPVSAATTAGIAISPGKFCSRSGPLFSPHHGPARGFEFTTPRSPMDGPRSPHWGVAFADELFQDGRILPLKLPPRLQHACPSTPGGRSPLRDSPASSWRRLLCRPGGGHKKDFDPFAAALERVRKAEPAGAGGEERRGFPTRRARSLSPLRSANWGGGRGSEGRRAPTPQRDQPWRACRLEGPILASPASWTGATHGQAMETSSEGSSGSEIRSAEGDGEDSEFLGFAAAGAREGGGARKSMWKKKAFAVSSWRGLFLCMGGGAFSK